MHQWHHIHDGYCAVQTVFVHQAALTPSHHYTGNMCSKQRPSEEGGAGERIEARLSHSRELQAKRSQDEVEAEGIQRGTRVVEEDAWGRETDSGQQKQKGCDEVPKNVGCQKGEGVNCFESAGMSLQVDTL